MGRLPSLLTADLKYQLAKNKPFVDASYSFPVTQVTEKKNASGSSGRKCSIKFFDKYPCLGYSKEEDGVYCVPCKLWPCNPERGTHASYLINEPYKDWKKIHGKMKTHMDALHHKESQLKMEKFMQVQAGQLQSALESQSSAHAKIVAKNKKIMGSLFACMRLCVERGFARRGKKDGGLPTIDEEGESESVNLGNFKAIVAFRVNSGDTILKEHLQTGANNAMYVSSAAQDDMLEIILDSIHEEIKKEARSQKGKFIYSVSADEVTDVSTKEQLGVVVRTVSESGDVQERLLEYIAVDSTSGLEISRSIVDCLSRHGFDIQDCRGQTYDGAGNMAGHISGCQTRIAAMQPLAEFHHCSSHCLNLALNKTSQIMEFKVLIENTKALGIFFKYSPKRQHALREILPNEMKVKKVKMLCETRWVERHNTFIELKMLYPHIIRVLEMMLSPGSGYDGKTAAEAAGLLNYLQSSKFVAAFTISEHMLGYTLPLSQQLQGSSKDIHGAYQNISEVIGHLKSARSDIMFDKLWCDMSAMFGEELRVPRLTGRQSLRANHDNDTAKEYYRRAYFFPYVDHLIEEMEQRFTKNISTTVRDGFLLIPSVSKDISYDEYKQKILSLAKRHNLDLPSPNTIVQETHTWFLKSQQHTSINNVKEAYKLALASGMYPNMEYLLKVLLTQAVTSAEVERCNSTLKFIKSKLRSTMSQLALNTQVLGYKHRDLFKKVKDEELVRLFALKKPRRLQLLNPVGM